MSTVVNKEKQFCDGAGQTDSRGSGLSDDLALHRSPVQLSVVVNVDGPLSIAEVDVDNFSCARRRDLGALERSDVAEEFRDVLLSHRWQQIRDDDLRAWNDDNNRLVGK